MTAEICCVRQGPRLGSDSAGVRPPRARMVESVKNEPNFGPASKMRIDRLVAALAEPSPKRFGLGTDRVQTPAATVERVWPLATVAGVSRLADVTGLDDVGIPVWCAMRPVSTNLSVSQGKGATDDAARASAVMESLEMWHAEQHFAPVITATLTELLERGETVADLARIGRYSTESGEPCNELDPSSPTRWTAGLELISGKHVLVPYEAVHCDGSLPLHPTEGVFLRGSNGLASGNCRTEAVLHGLYELVEREHLRQGFDGVDEDDVFGGVRFSAPRRIDAASIDDPVLRDVLGRFEAAGIDVGLFDATGSCGLPTVMAVTHVKESSELAHLNTVPSGFGSGTHLSRVIAIARAVTEAAQDRATVIAGSRDDIPRELYTDWAWESEQTRKLLEAPSTVQFTDLPNWSFDDLRDDLATAVAQVRAAGFDQIIACDMSLSPEQATEFLGDGATSAAAVVKMVVPGTRIDELEPPAPSPLPVVPAGVPGGDASGLDLDAVARTGIAVFAGPTLPGDLGRDLIEAAWLPPAECGDVWRVVRAGARTVVLIDGRYASVPAPWHKEIHWAMANGVEVIGASSMGALRAAEMHPFGMVGVGQVFTMYLNGAITADDEVAIAHGDASTDWMQLNDTLVDCRIITDAAAAAGVITADEAAAVVADLKSTFYPHRRLRESARRLLGDIAGEALFEYSRAMPRPKQSDALLALALAADGASASPTPPFADSSAWGLVMRTEEEWPER